ncbi:hypothetical protein JKF63_05532 [Porcisia hertigi]|uniref:Ion transport domain-containing protein n=1 Tax=Porcisia hertigi TaxID=2761500 RepID=A0A836IBL2_9TRYP|nr:hypothetical protein JKF63_05532 [Porcisia hertigi]
MQYLLLATSRMGTFQTWSPAPITNTNDGTTAFVCLKPRNAIRHTCSRFVARRSVQICWSALVCLSTAMALAIQPRYNMGRPAYTTLFSLQVVCLAFFWVRMVAEIIASGLLKGSHSFLRSWWNCVELVVNVFGLLQVIPPTSHIRWIRGFAALRPLRFFFSVPWWRQQLILLGRGFPHLLDVLITLGVCLWALALVGVMEVGGELYQRCYITKVQAPSPYATLTLPFLLRNVSTACGLGLSCPLVSPEVTVECLSIEHARRNDLLTYQNIGPALLLISKVASMDMWFEDLEDVMNVRGPGAALYLVVVVLVALFFFALFTSVIYNAYANFDMWCSPPAAVKGGSVARRRQDCGVQTQPVRSPTRPVHLGQRTCLVGDYGQPEGDVRDLSPFNDDGGCKHAVTSTLYIHAENTVVSHKSPRVLCDFMGGHLWMKPWTTPRDRESTTTPGAGNTPLSPFLASLVCSPPFVITLLALSMSQVVILAAVSTSTPHSTACVLRKISAALAIVFIVPVVLRVLAFGVVRTLTDFWNYVDVFSAVSGVLELAMPTLFNNRVVGALRVLRYIRLVKCCCPVYLYGNPLKSLICFFSFIFAMLTLFALLGTQLFAGTYDAAAAPAAIRNGDFNTTWTALLACFRAFTGDIWTRYMVAVSEGRSIATGSLFFVTLQVFSLVTLFALGISVIILGSRDAALAEDALRSQESPPLLLLPPMKADDTIAAEVGANSICRDSGGSPSLHVGATGRSWRRRRRGCVKAAGRLSGGKCFRVRGDAFFFLGPLSPLRVLLLRVLGSPFYALISALCVFLGDIALFFEQRHLDTHTERALHIFNIAYLVVFGMEMVIKWLAYGVVSPGLPHGEDDDQEASARYMPAYFMYPLNWVDFAANSLSLAAIFHPRLRVCRVIRTVRLLTTQERPNRTFLELVKLFRHLVKVLPLILFLYVSFAVAGMQLFAGGLFRCSDPVVTDWDLCVGEFGASVMGYTGATTVVQKRTRERAAFHYDAFGPALLSVFAVTTVNHWGFFMNDAMAVTSGPMSYNHSGYYVVFFIAALLSIRFFAIRIIAANLVAGVQRVMRESPGITGRTQDQTRFLASRECIVYMTQLGRLSPPLPGPVSRLFHRILSAQPPHWPNTVFSLIMQAVLVIVCAFLSITSANEELWRMRTVLGLFCVGVAFCGAEVVMAVWAYGVRHLSRAWYLADGALFTLMVVSFMAPQLRFMRVAMFVKLIKDANTALALLPAMRHIRILLSSGALGLLVLFTYAVVGTVLFGDVASDGVYLTEQRNFSTVLRSLLLLLNCSTFDEWHLVMHACFDGAACRGNVTATCGHTTSAVLFFVSFIVVESLLVGQLMLASLVAVFTVPLFVDVIQPFIEVRDVWRLGVGAGKISCDCETFLTLLPRFPASITDGISSETASEADMFAFLSSLQLPLDEHLQLRYEHVLRGFAYRKYKIDLIDDGADSRASDRVTYLTVGEYYGQQLLRKYCNGVSRLAQAKSEGMCHLSAGNSAAPLPCDSAGDHDVFRLHGDDLLVPKGALPIPNCNVFLYTFPGESNDSGASLSTQ